jgi:hypothetical protein
MAVFLDRCVGFGGCGRCVVLCCVGLCWMISQRGLQVAIYWSFVNVGSPSVQFPVAIDSGELQCCCTPIHGLMYDAHDASMIRETHSRHDNSPKFVVEC